MKANEAPKSKFVYPDKLYARCKDNNTLDVSYAHQNMEAVEYTRTDAFIEKACSWLKENGGSYWMDDYDLPTDELVNDFKNYIKGE